MFAMKNAFSQEKCIFGMTNMCVNVKMQGTRIWDHAKMRGRGASKNGLERKPGL